MPQMISDNELQWTWKEEVLNRHLPTGTGEKQKKRRSV